MKTSCVVLSGLIIVALIAVCVMVKFATEINIEDHRRESFETMSGEVPRLVKTVGLVSLQDGPTLEEMSERFPYLVAILKNSSTTWMFNCFGSMVLVRWALTSAHCRHPGHFHRALILREIGGNDSRTHQIITWRIHDKYNTTNERFKYDIALAKINIDTRLSVPKSAIFDERLVEASHAAIWKTIATMDRKYYLTNDIEIYDSVKISSSNACYEKFGTIFDESLICVDMSKYTDCFVTEFGPLFLGDKVTGILAAAAKDCDSKSIVFTNVSFYSDWIISTTFRRVL